MIVPRKKLQFVSNVNLETITKINFLANLWQTITCLLFGKKKQMCIKQIHTCQNLPRNYKDFNLTSGAKSIYFLFFFLVKPRKNEIKFRTLLKMFSFIYFQQRIPVTFPSANKFHIKIEMNIHVKFGGVAGAGKENRTQQRNEFLA